MTMRVRGAVWILLLASISMGPGCYQSQWVQNCEVEDDCRAGHCYRGYCFSEAEATKYGFSDSDIVYDNGDTELAEPVDIARFNTADILFVVDNTFTMTEEQDELSRSVGTLIRELRNRLLTDPDESRGEPIRFAVTTTDLGLSWNDEPYDVDDPFDLAPTCGERPYGDGGEMRTEYDEDVAESRSCVSPNEWVREDMYFEMETAGDDEAFDDEAFNDVMSCLLPVGRDGCAFEQQLSAVHRAILREDQHAFFRANALTVIIVVTDEDDCSIVDEKWIDLAESAPNPALVCGENDSMLFDIADMKVRVEAARREATGSDATDAILFAGIVGVPFDDACQGSGEEIATCLDVKLPGGGTMADPRMVNGEGTGKTSNYALACTRYSDDGVAMTQAYPATRIVKMAQTFGEMGYLFSVCSDDWSAAMTDISELIDSRMGAAISVE